MSEAQKLRSMFRALVRRFSISERADVSCCGMTVAQAATLEALDRCGSMRPGRLSELLGVSPSTLTRNLTRLEEGGFVEQQPDPEDRRASRVALSAAGAEAARRIEALEDEFAQGVLSRLDPQARRAALDGLTALLRAVREQTETCCPGAYEHLFSDEEVPCPTRS